MIVYSTTILRFIFFATHVLLWCQSISSQDILGRRESYLSYIYKLTDKEAHRIYNERNDWYVDSTYFHTLYDTYPKDSTYKKTLPPGYYLKMDIVADRQEIYITRSFDFDVQIFNNNKDLIVQVVDTLGLPIQNAIVSIRGKRLRYDKRLHAYIDRKSNQKGLLKVKYQNYISYHNIKRSYNNPLVKRLYVKGFYGTPIKYVWRPIRYVTHLPIDGVRSVIKGYSYGSISRTKNLAIKVAQKIDCMFGDCGYEESQRFSEKYQGYVIFSKPIYRPGDSILVKAFIVNRKGQPLNKETDLYMYGKGKDKFLTKLRPQSPGSYIFSFLPHDSLGLELDQTYFIEFRKNNQKTYEEAFFKYEEYELGKLDLSVRLSQDTWYQGITPSIYVSGRDENKLNILDGSLEILLKTHKIQRYYERQGFVPDTLFFLKTKLRQSGETEIVIPDSVFPHVDFTAQLQVNLSNTENEIETYKKEIVFYHKESKLDIRLDKDSVRFEYLENGLSAKTKAIIKAEDNFNNEKLLYVGTIPYALKLNPIYGEYSVTLADTNLFQVLDLSDTESGLIFKSSRNADSLMVQAINPGKLNFTYQLFRNNIKIDGGYSDVLNIKTAADSKVDYFLSTNYLWGGKVRSDTYKISFLENSLIISAREPSRIYPGQKAIIELEVKDQKGKPVPGVDITAVGLTQKFNFQSPDIPYLKTLPNKFLLVNEFNIQSQIHKNGLNKHYQYVDWRDKMGLDTLEYYKFIYPEGLYRIEYQLSNDSSQFAPYVFRKGVYREIHVIYVDKIPVYFSWTTDKLPYSFIIKPGFHQIALRTADRYITIDSIKINSGQKLIFSLDDNQYTKNVTINNTPSTLTEEERQFLARFTFPYRSLQHGNYAFLEHDGGLTEIYSGDPKRRITGPVSKNLQLNLADSIKYTFLYEPFFEYDFGEGWIKMRSIESNKYFPYFLNNNKLAPPVSDLAFTRKRISDKWQKEIDRKRSSKTIRKNILSQGPRGILSVKINDLYKFKELHVLNTVLLRHDSIDFISVYPGEYFEIRNLPKAYYRVVILFNSDRYLLLDSLYVKPGGTNYYCESIQALARGDTLSRTLNRLIMNNIYNVHPITQLRPFEQFSLLNVQLKESTADKTGSKISGVVYYKDTKEPIVGAAVLIQGTTMGAYTNENGFFELNVPLGYTELVVTYIGCNSLRISIQGNSPMAIYLEESVYALEEVVVTGYGVSGQRQLSAATVISHPSAPWGSLDGMEELENTVYDSTLFRTVQGRAPGVQIRGLVSLSQFQDLLYIVDGNVYTGELGKILDDIKEIQYLSDQESIAKYGDNKVKGVVLIRTNSHFTEENLLEAGEAEFWDNSAANQRNIRNNFSDNAFWKPSLRSNEYGKAVFEVTFPDDITSWHTMYFAMNEHKQSGKTEGSIKSYKPLSGQIAVPRFLVQTDTAHIIAKVLSYTDDSGHVETHCEVNDKKIFDKTEFYKTSIVDTIPIAAGADSLEVKYYLNRKDGYYDGEIRKIPVYPQGMEISNGAFYILDKDTTLRLSLDPAKGKIAIAAYTGIIDVLRDEIDYLQSYKYLCNEQLASKLKALLVLRSLESQNIQSFPYDKQIEKLITRLVNNMQGTGKWSWWDQGPFNSWVSNYVLNTLLQAKKAGFIVPINEAELIDKMIWETESSTNIDHSIALLKNLALLSARINYESYIIRLEKTTSLSFFQRLALLELRQLSGLFYTTDWIFVHQKESILGNVFFSTPSENIKENETLQTLMVYKILRNEGRQWDSLLNKIRMYFLEHRTTGRWANTYISAQIVETILPDILGKDQLLTPPDLTISGDTSMQISTFPAKIGSLKGGNLSIRQAGDIPVYVSVYQKYWEEKPEKKQGDFSIETTIAGKSDSLILLIGKPISLKARVESTKDASYVMINIPIPGSCSYAEKKSKYPNESHREYYKNEVAIFCEKLTKGSHEFVIELVPRYKGSYTLNPAKVELMYNPVNFANSSLKHIKVVADTTK